MEVHTMEVHTMEVHKPLASAPVTPGLPPTLNARTSATRSTRCARRLEHRIGELLDRPTIGRPAGESGITIPFIERHAAADFRLMAEHPDIVESVIEASSDESPASRRKVIAAIKGHNERTAIAAALAEAQPHAENIERLRADLPNMRRPYLVTIRIQAHPDHIKQALPFGTYELVTIHEENTQS